MQRSTHGQIDHGYIGHTGTFFLSFSDCLSRESQTKISAVLNNMVTVGSVDCAEEEALCKFLGRRSGVVFYPAKEVTPERETVCELVLKLCSIFFLIGLEHVPEDVFKNTIGTRVHHSVFF